MVLIYTTTGAFANRETRGVCGGRGRMREYGILRMFTEKTELRFFARVGGGAGIIVIDAAFSPAMPSVIFRFLRKHPYSSVGNGGYAQSIRVCPAACPP